MIVKFRTQDGWRYEECEAVLLNLKQEIYYDTKIHAFTEKELEYPGNGYWIFSDEIDFSTQANVTLIPVRMASLRNHKGELNTFFFNLDAYVMENGKTIDSL